MSQDYKRVRFTWSKKFFKTLNLTWKLSRKSCRVIVADQKGKKVEEGVLLLCFDRRRPPPSVSKSIQQQ